MVNHYEVNVIFQDTEHQLQKKFPSKYFLSTQNYLLEAFATLSNHTNYLHPNIEYRAIPYFYYHLPCTCC